jgi:hypothetical protein
MLNKREFYVALGWNGKERTLSGQETGEKGD